MEAGTFATLRYARSQVANLARGMI